MKIGEPENEKTWAHIVNGKVVNVSVWDGVTPYEPAEELVELTGPGGIGWDYVDGGFVDNRPVEDFDESTEAELEESSNATE